MNPRVRVRITASLAGGALYLLICAGCAVVQRHLIYFPPVLGHSQVETLGSSNALQRWNAPDGTSVGWKRLAPAPRATGRLLILHGNAGCAFQCAHYADVLQKAAPLDVFMVEYPGYADRPGKPTERSLEAAASEAFNLLPADLPVFLVGESLGTGVAAWLAGHYSDRVAGVILLAPYNCLGDVAQAHVRILPVRWLLCDRFPAEEYLRGFHGPLAVVVGGSDRVVPKKFGRLLFEGYAGPKHLWEIPGASHDQLMFQPLALWSQLLTFCQTRPAANTP